MKYILKIQALTKLSQVDMIGNLLHRVKARNPDNFPNCGGLPFEFSWSHSDCQSLDLHLGTNGYKSPVLLLTTLLNPKTFVDHR